jgi:transposase
LSTVEGRERLVEVAAGQLSPAGQIQLATGIDMLEATERQLEQIRGQLVGIARHVRGAKTLTDSLYGVGPITALALTCWLGGADRFSSARKAVRFAGLDITV